MRDTQYKVVVKATGETYGWIVGKTPNQELVIQLPNNRTKLLKINDKNLAKYTVLKIEFSA